MTNAKCFQGVGSLMSEGSFFFRSARTIEGGILPSSTAVELSTLRMMNSSRWAGSRMYGLVSISGLFFTRQV